MALAFSELGLSPELLAAVRAVALQVAGAIHTYDKGLGPLRVLLVYGGKSMEQQVRRLRGGTHVVVGTRGRVMDHLRRGTLGVDAVRTVVLDEADEMLRMGFLEDVEWILARMPAERQMALFSATMPPEIRRIATRHLRDPELVQIERQTLTVPTVDQRYLTATERQQLDALTRVLEVEAPDTTLIFVRTRTGAADLRERLQALGYTAEAMHGDMTQQQREAVVQGLRTGYVHRIGRTARAGRPGTAILFVTPVKRATPSERGPHARPGRRAGKRRKAPRRHDAA